MGLIKIGDEIVDVFDADGEADQAVGDADLGAAIRGAWRRGSSGRGVR